MTVGVDWVTVVAKELASLSLLSEQGVAATIIKYCPFKPDVAYMPVPRCDSCKHLRTIPKNPLSQQIGRCERVFAVGRLDGQILLPVTADFGCVLWEAK